MARSSGAGTLKTYEKLEKSVQDGKYYEAQQMYKTIYARYVGAKKYTEALDLLQSGASVQLRHGQITCGVELGMLLIETLSASKTQYSEDSLARIRSVYAEFPRKQQPDGSIASEELDEVKKRVEGMQSFLKAAIKWSSEFGGPSRGSPELHELLAEYLSSQSPKPEFSKAAQHFVRGNCPEAFGRAIIQAMSQCEVDERDLILARGVLLYLSLGNMRDANKLMDYIQLNLINSPFVEVLAAPLTHFLRFLLLTLERDALSLFRMLRQNYKWTLERDQSLDELLDVIGEKFYNLRRKNGIQSMLGDFMKMFDDPSTFT